MRDSASADATQVAVDCWTAASLFFGDDDTARAHRDIDWSATPLGAVETWPTELTAAVATVFASDVAMLLWLGPDLVQVFNDAFRPFLGVKYPAAVGQPAAQCWPDVWEEMGPLAESALQGRTTKGTEVRLLMDRRGGLLEETYWTFSYSPIRRFDCDVLGVFVATSDVTDNVLGRRRMNAVQQLGSISATRRQHPAVTCRTATSTLSKIGDDFPLVMTYLDPISTFDTSREHRLGGSENVVALVDGRVVELVAVGGGMAPDDAHGWLADGPGVKAVAEVAHTGDMEHLKGLSGDGNGRGPVVDDVPLDDVVVLPLRIAGREEPVGVLVVGVSPFHVVDDQYLEFLDVVAGRVSTTLTDVLAFEYERQRSTALADVDAAKTHFLENISHEFRTPLTLLLAPLKDLLESSAEPSEREIVETAYRNAARLKELVDSLLDVAGASTGAIVVDREATDIVELTRGCIAQFDNIVTTSDLSLNVDLDPVESRQVMIDREKWTRIVTNLVSNAVKYTHSGSVDVSMSSQGSDIVLQVADTGIGIEADHLPHVFDRFYRVDDARGRSAEGSGIGLALVSELASAMGGTVTVDSVADRGTTFTVIVPADASRADSPSGRPLPRTADSVAGLSVPQGQITSHGGVNGGGSRSVLVVEDNPDMADYLVRLLTAQDWDVHVAGEVESALAFARGERPGLVLTDVMLPGRSGLDLVTELRSDPSLVRVPIVVLSARAGTSAAVEGLRTGADDYVAKPFEQRELLARVRVHLELSAIREELLVASDNETATLHEALRTRSTIGTAIGLLMAAENCDAETAFRRLTTLSQHSNRKARDVAEEMVRNHGR